VGADDSFLGFSLAASVRFGWLVPATLGRNRFVSLTASVAACARAAVCVCVCREEVPQLGAVARVRRPARLPPHRRHTRRLLPAGPQRAGEPPCRPGLARRCRVATWRRLACKVLVVLPHRVAALGRAVALNDRSLVFRAS
jgi:hypothetical protein